MESKAYEIYRNAVGGITFNGDKMKELDELPKKIQDAWKAVDEHYDEKIDGYKQRIADMIPINDGDDSNDNDACDCKSCRNIRCSVCRSCWKTVEEWIHY